MVRILANGEIVQDDDPRVPQNNTGSRNRYGYVNNTNNDDPQYEGRGGVFNNGNGGPTMFDTWNQKLLELGIPRWNVGTHVVEPIMTVMFLAVLLIFGLQGVLLLGLLYFVVKISQKSANTRQQQRRPNRNTRPPSGAGGRRLGR